MYQAKSKKEIKLTRDSPNSPQPCEEAQRWVKSNVRSCYNMRLFFRFTRVLFKITRQEFSNTTLFMITFRTQSVRNET